MYRKLILNDLRRGKLIAIAITCFILAAAALTSLAATLAVNLFGAIDALFEAALPPHFMQMHAGDLDQEQLLAFAQSQENVEAYQLAEFLNIDGADIQIGANSLLGSVQDNGFSIQSPSFDFLLDRDSRIIHPRDGEVYVPLGYLKDGTAQIGDTLTVQGVSLTVAGFLRDAQMNSDLAGSKRFLVSEGDFARLESHGTLEYLIEFRLKDPSAFPAFQSAYFAAGLPANGPPALSEPLFRMVSALTDGMMIAVLALVSLLVVLVAFLCIRFTLLAKIEEDYREIGVLKAVGLRVSDIARLYAAKYGALAGIACVLGFLLSLPLGGLLMENIRLYMGEGEGGPLALLIGAGGSAVIFLAVMLYVRAVLRRFRKISAAQAVRFGAPREKSRAARGMRLSRNRLWGVDAFLGIHDVLSRKKLYVTMFLVLVIATFLLVVPQNIYNTIADPSFVTYMGIGQSDLQIYLMQTQTDDIPGSTSAIAAALEADDDVARYTVLTGLVFNMPTENGSIERLRVSLGDHTAFPITYSAGVAPTGENDIALSTLYADDLGKRLGDAITLIVDGQEKRLTVCGVYSDVTNAGKTAQAAFRVEDADFLRSSVMIDLQADVPAREAAARYRQLFPFASVMEAEDSIQQTFGSTVDAIQKASYAAIAATVVLTVLITLLFMKMLVAKDRQPIAILQSLGFTNRAIRLQYVLRSVVVLIAGVAVGTLLANTLGESVGGLLISSFGASTFHFRVNPAFAYLLSPLLIALCVYVATLLGVSGIRSVTISAQIKEV